MSATNVMYFDSFRVEDISKEINSLVIKISWQMFIEHKHLI